MYQGTTQVLGETWVVPWCMQGLLSLVLPVQASLGAIFALARAIGASTRFLCIREAP
jgi:hypothetical protein